MKSHCPIVSIAFGLTPDCSNHAAFGTDCDDCRLTITQQEPCVSAKLDEGWSQSREARVSETDRLLGDMSLKRNIGPPRFAVDPTSGIPQTTK